MLASAWQQAALAPVSAGVGLRAPHYREILATQPDIGWFEAHSENYFGAGGQPLAYLEAIRTHYPVSLHGVGLSLGSTDALSEAHLAKLKRLADRIEPCFVSEHLSWSSVDGRFFNELLPLPYSEEALQHVVKRCDLSRREVFEAMVEDAAGLRMNAHGCLPACVGEPDFRHPGVGFARSRCHEPAVC